MLPTRYSAHADDLSNRSARAGVVGSQAVRAVDEPSTLTTHVAAALLATILLSGYMVAVG
jgi:flagellar motor component MotA